MKYFAKLERSLDTERLVLEPMRVHHATELFEGLRDPQLYHFIPQSPPDDVLALERRCAAISQRHSPDGRELWLNWVLRRKCDRHVVGVVEASVNLAEELDPSSPNSADLAYFVFRQCWRNGYAREACLRVIQTLIDDCACSHVRATIDSRNIASLALAESLGMTEIRLTKAADVFKGKISDEFQYELTAKQWLARDERRNYPNKRTSER